MAPHPESVALWITVSPAPTQSPLFRLCNVLLELRLLSLIHLLASHLHSCHHGSDLVSRYTPPLSLLIPLISTPRVVAVLFLSL